MDLISGQGRTRKGGGGHGGSVLGAVLLAGKDRAGGQQPQPPHGLRRTALRALRVGQRLAQHLIPAADPQHRRAVGRQLQQGCFQPGLPQPKQVIHCVLGAGQDDEIRCAQLAGILHIPHAQQRMLLQRHEIGKVGDVRQTEDGRIQRVDRSARIQPGGKGILVLNVHLQVGYDPQHRQLRFFFQHRKAGTQDLHIAAEFIDEQPLDAGALLWLQQRHRAVQLGEHTAPVDVSRQQNGGIHQPGKAHVDDIVCLQIDLRRASGPLNDNDVHGFGQTVVGREDLRDERSFHFEVGGGGHLAPHLAVHDDLTAHVTAGLEQDGVHPHIRLDACGLRLHHLCPAHFQPIPGDKAVQRHVLALEGSHAVTVLRKNAAEGGAQQAFACTAHGSLHHDALCLAHSSTSARSFKSCSFSGPVRTAVRYQPGPSPG